MLPQVCKNFASCHARVFSCWWYVYNFPVGQLSLALDFVEILYRGVGLGAHKYIPLNPLPVTSLGVHSTREACREIPLGNLCTVLMFITRGEGIIMLGRIFLA